MIRYTCGSGANQQFQMVANSGYFRLRARHSGKCVDVPAAPTAAAVANAKIPRRIMPHVSMSSRQAASAVGVVRGRRRRRTGAAGRPSPMGATLP
ncbi:RICIN domain-containing protein [Micromonospora sp. NPDC005313]|uniref:RICIN domain-containing protein n=1 Tax=Micromonospora sp. NPDC005313 TaxID=3154296 RepID=UPI00339F8604